MNVGDVMTQNVISVTPDATVLQAARLMLQNGISGLPVIDPQGNLLGVVTEGDFLRRAETDTERQRPRWLENLMWPGRRAAEYVQTHGRKVAEVMTPEPYTTTEETALEQAVKLMEKHRIKRLPVVRGSKVVGILTRANLLHAFASAAGKPQAALGSDTAIRQRLLADLAKANWAPLPMLNVVVQNGIVNLWGTITDERQRQGLVVAAENVPGVKGVQDHLAWVEPTSGMVFLGPADAAGDATTQKAAS